MPTVLAYQEIEISIMNTLHKLAIEVLKPGPDFAKRAVIVACAVFSQGFFLSFLILLNLGTDPCTFMNVNLARVFHLSFGTWQLILQALLMLFVVCASRLRYIGLGTLLNMTLIGYVADFFRYLWGRVLPQSWFTLYPAKALLFAVTLLGFVVSAAFYMNAEMGVSPYDATPMIFSSWLPRIPFIAVRMFWDYLVVIIGLLAGGKPPIGTLIMCIALGPVINLIGRLMRRVLHGSKAAAIEA